MRILTLVMLALSSSSAISQTPLPKAEPPYYRVRYEPSKQPRELVFGVSYTVWIPPGVKTLRGVVVHQHGCGEGACRAGRTAAFDLHWQALARKNECALLGPSYEQPETENCGLWSDPRNGSEKKYLQALAELAKLSGHPELEQVPWALWGHSGGAAWVGTMLMLHPKRIACVWLRSGSPRLVPREDSALPPVTIPDAALAVPVMSNQGTKEGVTETEGRFARVWGSTQQFFKDFRGKGGLIGVSVDPLSSHDCGNQRYLAIPWIDACLAARLPEKTGDALKPMPIDSVWLASFHAGEPQPATKYSGDARTSVWLPSERIAKLWAEYIQDTKISDTTPPPAPKSVRADSNGSLSWEAEADFESGIASFIIQRDGQDFATVPEKPAGSIGRQIFQKNSYSDTPSEPLVEMRYVDSSVKAGEKHEYRIIAVNSVGLKSEPAMAVAP